MTHFAETSWQTYGGCATSTVNPIGKGHPLAKQRSESPFSPFIYRWGFDFEWSMADAEVDATVERTLAWLDATKVNANVVDCELPNRVNAVGSFFRERKGGTSVSEEPLKQDFAHHP